MFQKKGPKFLINLFEILEVVNLMSQRVKKTSMLLDGTMKEMPLKLQMQICQQNQFQVYITNSLTFLALLGNHIFVIKRQLNQYGFHKQKIDKHSFSFRHKYFQKNKKELIAKIISSHKQKVREFQREQRENLFNDNEQNVQTKTIQELQQNQHKIFTQFKEQMNTQLQIKQLITYLKNVQNKIIFYKKIAEFNIQIEQQCFVAQTLLFKVIKTIPNDEQYQFETDLLKQVLQEFSNIYLEYYGYNQSQRSPNLSILQFTPLPFQMNEQQKRSLGLIDTKKVHLHEQITQYLKWVKESYENAIIRNAI